MSISDSESAKNWLRQFMVADQRLAADLLNRFMLVSRDELNNGLRALVLEKASGVKGPIGLYAERELPRACAQSNARRVTLPLFKEKRREKAVRAYGGGISAVESPGEDGHSVGSEGIVATLINQLCREDKTKFVSHPGPDAIRKFRIRRLWVLTDLIGSGTRAATFIEAAWAVRSVRSWWSGTKMRLGVLAYASTDAGHRRAQRHRCKPKVWTVVPCPTVAKEFKSDTAVYRALCEKYDPVPFKPKGFIDGEKKSLGYDNTGALIAFAHGAPNNTPNIFHRTGKARPDWVPLFPARVTSGLPDSEFGVSMSEEVIADRLRRLGEQVLAKSPAASTASTEVKKRLLVMAALSRSNRKANALAYATGLTIPEAEAVIKELADLGWVDQSIRLTDLGSTELRQTRRHAKSLKIFLNVAVPNTEKSHYYPKSLRSPI